MIRTRSALLAQKFHDANQSYARRMMLSLAASLLAALGIVHLRVELDDSSARWHAANAATVMVADYVRLLPGSLVEGAAPAEEAAQKEEDQGEEAGGDEDTGQGMALRLQRDEMPDVAAAQVRVPIERLPPTLPRVKPVVQRIAQAAPMELAAFSDVFDSASLDDPPALQTSSLRIYYPDDAKQRGIEGMVVLHFLVDADGRPSGINVLSPLCPSCDAAAVKALQAARFTPGRTSGRPTAAFTRLGIRFSLR